MAAVSVKRSIMQVDVVLCVVSVVSSVNEVNKFKKNCISAKHGYINMATKNSTHTEIRGFDIDVIIR